MKAVLALADGRIFEGTSFGAQGEVTGEIIFNTSMTGYQEVITDPSYCGQMIVLTYPLMGIMVLILKILNQTALTYLHLL